MKQTVSIFRVFTDNHLPTLGNPAGVVLSDQVLPVGDMKTIAIAANQPMTAFISPHKQKAHAYNIHYYDLGGRECHICGHATLATTAYLGQRGLRGRRVKRNLSS